jgi:hypothetical protein
MSECAYLIKCPFLSGRMSDMPAMAEFYRIRYCRGRFKDCARLIVRQELGPENVPIDLYPSQKERVKFLIRKVKSS